jgi:hypothetical protein
MLTYIHLPWGNQSQSRDDSSNPVLRWGTASNLLEFHGMRWCIDNELGWLLNRPIIRITSRSSEMWRLQFSTVSDLTNNSPAIGGQHSNHRGSTNFKGIHSLSSVAMDVPLALSLFEVHFQQNFLLKSKWCCTVEFGTALPPPCVNTSLSMDLMDGDNRHRKQEFWLDWRWWQT